MSNQEINDLKQAEETTLVTSNSLDGSSAITDPEDPLTPNTKDTRAPHITNSSTIEINPLFIIGLLAILVIGWLIILSLKEIFRTNPYGEQIKIDNFSRHFGDMLDDDRDSIYNTLYITARSNSLDDIEMPKKGATIRDGSANTEYNEKDNTYTSTFLVDIPDLQQTYNFWVYWSTDPENTDIATVGYTVMTYCPTEDQLIYPAFECVDSRTDQGVYSDPVIRLLPLQNSYYTNNYSQYIYYRITFRANDSNTKLTLIITSYSQDVQASYDAALQALREQGINPDDYDIEYVNKSEYSITPGRTEDYN